MKQSERIRTGQSGRVLRRTSLLRPLPHARKLNFRSLPALFLIGYLVVLFIYVIWLLVDPVDTGNLVDASEDTFGSTLQTVLFVSPIAIALLFFGSIGVKKLGFRKGHRMRGSQQKLLTDEFQAAYQMQQSLLPEGEARLYGYDISAAMEPAVEVGGDYYDYLTFADGTKGILVADASGKGIPAALVMAKFQGMAGALASYISDPSEFFVGLNDTLRVRQARGRFITVGMVTIDFEDRCNFWRAGHNELIHYVAATDELVVRRPPGIALGMSHGGHVGDAMEPEQFTIEEGDTLLLYSDGLSEACGPDGTEFGESKLEETFHRLATAGIPAREVRDHLLKELRTFTDDEAGQDDVTIVVIRRG